VCVYMCIYYNVYRHIWSMTDLLHKHLTLLVCNAPLSTLESLELTRHHHLPIVC